MTMDRICKIEHKKDVRIEKPYSVHQDDSYLSVVLANCGGYHPWVTWIFNKNDVSYFWGHYFEHYNDALDDFNKRGCCQVIIKDSK